MTLINDVDSHTSIAEIKNKYEKTKYQLARMKENRDSYSVDLSKLVSKHSDLE